MVRPYTLKLTLASLAHLALAAWVIGSAVPAAAATIPVNTLADADLDDSDCSLREAIQAANDDVAHFGCPAGNGVDIVEIDLTGTIALGSNLPIITRSLTIAGPASGTLTINGGNHVMLILNGAPDGRTLRLERLTIRNGLHSTGGGCITVREGDRLELVDSRVTGCETNLEGGAIYGDLAASITLQRSTIDNNVAGGGAGGIFLFGEGATLAASSAPGATSRLVRSGILPITVPEGGGEPTAVLRIEDSTISGNSSLNESVGGGVVSAWANGEVVRSTLSGNSTEDWGGGLLVIYGSILVDSSTLTSNTADADLDDTEEVGAGLYLLADAAAPAVVTLHNSVIANNFGGAILSDAVVGANSAIVSEGFNLIGVRDGAAAFFPIGAPNADADWVGARTAPVVAGLAALADNGGPTKTHAPSPGSLLVDRGECPGALRDQRGYGDLATLRRPADDALIPDAADGCDIGAYEADGVALPFILFVDGFEGADTGAWSAVVP